MVIVSNLSKAIKDIKFDSNSKTTKNDKTRDEGCDSEINNEKVYDKEYLEIRDNINRNKDNNINLIIKKIISKDNYDYISNNKEVCADLLYKYCKEFNIDIDKSKLLKKLQIELDIKKTKYTMPKWFEKYEELFDKFNCDKNNIIEELVVEFVEKLECKEASYNKYFSHLCNICDILHIEIDRSKLKKIYNKEIEEKRTTIIKGNVKIKVKEELKYVEEILQKKDVYLILEKFIMTNTYNFDNLNITLKDYMEKINNFIEYLNYKKLVSKSKEIDIIYVNYIIECKKWKLYMENMSNEIGLIKGENINSVISKYVSFYSANCKNELKIKILSKLLKRETNEILNLVKQEEEKIIKEYKIKIFEEELYGNKSYKIGTIDKLNGYEFEDFLSELFKSFGFDVEPTSYSGDYGADIIVKNAYEKMAIQAKNYSGKVGVEAIQQALSGKEYYKCDRAIVITNSYFTKQAIDLATVSKVELIDRDKLIEILEGKIKYF